MPRKPFLMREASKGKGIVALQHSVRLTNGEQMQLRAKSRPRAPVPKDTPINRVKTSILNRLPQQEARIRTLVTNTLNEFERALTVLDGGRNRRTGLLSPAERQRAVSRLDEIISKFSTEAQALLQQNAESAVRGYLGAIKAQAGDKGRKMKVVEASRSAAEEMMSVVVAGATTRQRVGLIAARMRAELVKSVDMDYLTRVKRKPTLKARLIDPKGGSTPCVARGLARLNRSEQNRAMHKATEKVMREAGVELAYWRLSAAHKSYGGNEICEVLAESTGIGVNEALDGRSASISTVGLYTIDNFPDIPHPNCMCSIEPVFN